MDEMRFARFIRRALPAARGVKHVLSIGKNTLLTSSLHDSIEVIEADRTESAVRGVIESCRNRGIEFLGVYYGRSGKESPELDRLLLSWLPGQLVPHGILLWDGILKSELTNAKKTLSEIGFNIVEGGARSPASLLARKRDHCCLDGQPVFYDRSALMD